MAVRLKAGLARSDITPAIGTELAGHFRSDLKSIGIHSNLYAKVLILNDGTNYGVLVACDLLGVNSDLVASTRDRISNLTGIDGRNVMIGCTHTHSGPGCLPLRFVGKNDEAYQEQLEKKIAGTIYLALRNMKEASVGRGVGRENLAVSRRNKWPDGSIRSDWPDSNEPVQSIDDELNVLTLNDADGKILGAIINYACHPTTMGTRIHETSMGGRAFNLISSDFPGVATSLMERVEGDGTTALFFNGAYADTCARGDIVSRCDDHMDEEGDELTTTLGTILGADALKISRSTNTNSEISIQVMSETVRAPLEATQSKVELQERIIILRRKVEELRRSGAPRGELRWPVVELSWYEYLLELLEKGGGFEKYENLEVQAMRIGDIYLVGFPGEIFSQIGLNVKSGARSLGLDKILVFALTNGDPGYIPSEDDYNISPIGKRGYELEGSYMLYGRPLVGPGTATLLNEAAIKLIRDLMP